MKKVVLASTAMLLSFSPSIAQTPAPAGSDPASQHASTANLQQQITNNLQEAGFTEIKVMPDSFLVQAKDKSGNPVTMFINPNSLSEVTTIGSASGNRASGGTIFTTLPANESLSSKIVGLDVYNKSNQDIGTIKDVAFDQNGVKAYIVGVGGFLGMGDHYVAVSPSAISVTWNNADKKWHAAMDTNADQLKGAPEFKYSNG